MSEAIPEAAVDAVIVQLDAGSVLLPRSAFLEVTTRAGAVEQDVGHPGTPWLEPSLIWQDVQVPVVNVNGLLGAGNDRSRSRFNRLLVMQGMVRPEELPFYALEVRGAPHPVRVTPQNIYALEDVDTAPWAWRVKASGVTTYLLRLDALEERLLQMGSAETT